MMRTLIVADEGGVFAAVTAMVSGIDRVEIAGYASGAAPIDRIVAAMAPDVVLVDEMRWSGLALARIREARAADALAVVVGLARRPDAGWILEGLHAGATAVVPREMAPATFAQLLRETLAGDRGAREPAAVAAA
jgi:DNA-binding NarL/FixJ family response regulator